MTWNIVTDSSCDFNKNTWDQKTGISLKKVPFTIRIGKKEYVDSEELNVRDMLEDMEHSPDTGRTSCPTPERWYDVFRQADQTIAITISSRLSGSYNSAYTAKTMIEETYRDKKIFILDSRSAGSALALLVEKAAELIRTGKNFEEVTEALQEYASRRHTIFALSSFTNLIKNGRISKLSGIIAGKLGIWGVGIANQEGNIVIKDKIRGSRRVIHNFLEDMKKHGFSNGTVVISHCQNPELAQIFKESILARWAGAKITILSTGGLCSYYAERKGLIIAY